MLEIKKLPKQGAFFVVCMGQGPDASLLNQIH